MEKDVEKHMIYFRGIVAAVKYSLILIYLIIIIIPGVIIVTIEDNFTPVEITVSKIE